ncbi:MAG TPA: HAMP domain-containing sensor histidine kinase [Balneolaceae bacterium]|nr:HAMP domain-containing sensor histidine kinase [Balneolaceae bacterium]
MRANTTPTPAMRSIKSPGKQKKTPINKTVQTLLNGYEQPTVLSDAQNGHIVFVNKAAQQKIGLSYQSHGDQKLDELFSSQSTVDQYIIWERCKNRYEISEKKLEIEGKKYIHSVFKVLEEPELINLQKEMAKLLVHRFHSPLNGVTGFTELLKDLSLTETQQQYIHSIETGLDDFKNILANINELAQDINVRLDSIAPNELTSKILTLYSPNEQQKIEITADSEITRLHTDPILLKAMIKELLDNALTFGDDANPEIRLHFRKDHTISVSNSGSPILAAQTQKIFYPFFSSKARGIGLGLAKCEYFGQALGYELSLASNSSKKGIRFEIQMK